METQRNGMEIDKARALYDRPRVNLINGLQMSNNHNNFSVYKHKKERRKINQYIHMIYFIYFFFFNNRNIKFVLMEKKKKKGNKDAFRKNRFLKKSTWVGWFRRRMRGELLGRHQVGASGKCYRRNTFWTVVEVVVPDLQIAGRGLRGIWDDWERAWSREHGPNRRLGGRRRHQSVRLPATL